MYTFSSSSSSWPPKNTQALLYAATITQYDLGTPVTPLPREGGTSVIPFCLTLFNFATLDDFSTFVNNGTFNNTVGGWGWAGM